MVSSPPSILYYPWQRFNSSAEGGRDYPTSKLTAIIIFLSVFPLSKVFREVLFAHAEFFFFKVTFRGWFQSFSFHGQIIAHSCLTILRFYGFDSQLANCLSEWNKGLSRFMH